MSFHYELSPEYAFAKAAVDQSDPLPLQPDRTPSKWSYRKGPHVPYGVDLAHGERTSSLQSKDWVINMQKAADREKDSAEFSNQKDYSTRPSCIIT
jgi:hypothetical protein